jgi:transcriptional regulator with XRE-family HTH domain
MAHVLGLNRSYLAEIELGRTNPSLMNIEVIADGFEITISTLFARVHFRARRPGGAASPGRPQDAEVRP